MCPRHHRLYYFKCESECKTKDAIHTPPLGLTILNSPPPFVHLFLGVWMWWVTCQDVGSSGVSSLVGRSAIIKVSSVLRWEMTWGAMDTQSSDS